MDALPPATDPPFWAVALQVQINEMQGQMSAMQEQMQTMHAQMEGMYADLKARMVLLVAKSHKVRAANCTLFEVVCNAAGDPLPAGSADLEDIFDFADLSDASQDVWLAYYGRRTIADVEDYQYLY